MTSSLVGSEMCIRDSRKGSWPQPGCPSFLEGRAKQGKAAKLPRVRRHDAVSYTHLTLPTICSV
eukprot:2867279-Prorocentrum_lima.AAC.1